MKRKEPIIFNEERPIAHYERAQKLKKKADRILSWGRLVPVAAFIIGVICVLYNPAMMAANAFFGLLFSIFSYCGCWLRRPVFCLISMPLGLIASLAAALSGSEYAVLGAVAFLTASLLQSAAIQAASDYHMLKELPGFPFFDVSMDEITFAAKDRFGSDEFIDESELHEEKKDIYIPLRKPSDVMSDINPPKVPELTKKEIRKMEGDKVWTYEHHRESDISDVDLFE